MPSLYRAFSQLRERPSLFTGEHTLASISQLLAGYSLAVELHDTQNKEDPFLLPGGFNDWVAYRLHFYEATSGWCRMISDRSSTDAGSD